MSRHCVPIRLDDGTVVSLQFGHRPTEAEIKSAKEGLEKDVAALKAGLPRPARPRPKPEEEYP